jgi:hypothetical protein
MTLTAAFVLILAVPLVLWAIRADSRRGRTKTREELLVMLASGDWRYWKIALKELGRRGEDTSIHIPKLLPHLLADTHTVREATRITLVNQFPELRDALRDYRAADEADASRGKLTSLFEKYEVRAG